MHNLHLAHYLPLQRNVYTQVTLFYVTHSAFWCAANAHCWSLRVRRELGPSWLRFIAAVPRHFQKLHGHWKWSAIGLIPSISILRTRCIVGRHKFIVSDNMICTTGAVRCQKSCALIGRAQQVLTHTHTHTHTHRHTHTHIRSHICTRHISNAVDSSSLLLRFQCLLCVLQILSL